MQMIRHTWAVSDPPEWALSDPPECVFLGLLHPSRLALLPADVDDLDRFVAADFTTTPMAVQLMPISRISYSWSLA